MIRVTCQNCGQVLSARPELAGKSAICSRCKAVIPIPISSPTSPNAEASPDKIKVECNSCHASLRIPATLQGKAFACPKCGTKQTASAESTGIASRPNAPPPSAKTSPPPAMSFSASQPTNRAKSRDSNEPTDVVDCPHCGEPNDVDEDSIGTKIRCRACRERFRVPDPRDDELDSDLEDSDQDDDFDRPRRRRRRSRQPKESKAGQVCSILSIVFGVIALLICPPFFGIAGITLGIIGTSISPRKTLGVIGIIISVIGMIAGVAIGIFVAMKMNLR